MLATKDGEIRKPRLTAAVETNHKGATRIGGFKERKHKMNAKFDDAALNAENARSFHVP